MSSNAISVRLEPLSGRKAQGQRSHDIREKGKIPEYVDSSATKLNSILMEPPHPSVLRREISKNRKEHGQQKLRADARIAFSGIITFGKEAQEKINRMGYGEQDLVMSEVAERVAKETGHSLIGLAVHRDETAVHCHFMLRGYRQDESGKEQPLRLGTKDLSFLQTAAAEEVKSIGISRGTPKKEREEAGEDKSKTIHRSVKRLHEDLPDELRRIEQELRRVKQYIESKGKELSSKFWAAVDAFAASSPGPEEEEDGANLGPK